MIEVGTVAGIAGALVAISSSVAGALAIAYKMGKWKGEVESQYDRVISAMEKDHQDFVDAHEAMHRDVKRLAEHTDHGRVSMRENCPVCDSEEDLSVNKVN